jgi:2'-5' RNA ligase
MRIFIAVRPDKNLLSSMLKFQTKLKNDLFHKEIRWVNPEQFHLTLIFLGEIDSGKLSKLIENLNQQENIDSFNLSFEGLGYFGKANSLRTIWLGIEKSSALNVLFRNIYDASSFLMQKKPNSFNPHITLARVSDKVSKDNSLFIANYLDNLPKPIFGDCKIDSFELIESRLTANGPIYKTIKKFNLR